MQLLLPPPRCGGVKGDSMMCTTTICTTTICRETIGNATKARKSRAPKVHALALLALFFSSLAFGQGGVATGDLRVTVKDPKGNLITNATVTVSDVAKGFERTATSDGQGGYNARLLPPASYAVT